ncbi:MAG: hypothetical protein JO287_19355, partial [Pseudonocardiales bacterium]|nr:hypothetical protein [Pseudonocardiales bacterium]
PRSWVEATGVVGSSVAGSADAWHQQTECLLTAPDPATVHVRLRFLQLQHRSVEGRCPDGGFEQRDVLDVDGQRHLTFDEAVPREFDIAVQTGELHGEGHTATIEVPGGEDVEPLGEVGRVVRRRWPISATVRLSVTPVDASPDVLRLRVVTENTADSMSANAPRSEALRTSLVATHSLVGVHGGAFLSMLDPPAWAAAAAQQCRNVHTFPVLAGEVGDRRG